MYCPTLLPIPSSLKYWTIMKRGTEQQKGGVSFVRSPTTINASSLLRAYKLLKNQWHDQESNFIKYTVQTSIWNIFAVFYQLGTLFFWWFRMRYHEAIP